MQPLLFSQTSRELLIRKLQDAPEVIEFTKEPALAALCTCLGLQFEVGEKPFDRLSPFLGVDIQHFEINPWASELVEHNSEIGVRFWRKDGQTLTVRHPDLQFILDRGSFDDRMVLTQAVIFPSRVARAFAEKGFRLVIVRDWLLNTCLQLDASRRVSYLHTNAWEIEQNIAFTQVRMMGAQQLAFFGTHDIVDHLLSADIGRFNASNDIFEIVLDTYSGVFDGLKKSTADLLQISYLIGVMLDDLAQPKWYESTAHREIIILALEYLKKNKVSGSTRDLGLPRSFHDLVECVRSAPEKLFMHKLHFQTFIKESVS